jgi:hypothetical protein
VGRQTQDDGSAPQAHLTGCCRQSCSHRGASNSHANHAASRRRPAPARPRPRPPAVVMLATVVTTRGGAGRPQARRASCSCSSDEST